MKGCRVGKGAQAPCPPQGFSWATANAVAHPTMLLAEPLRERSELVLQRLRHLGAEAGEVLLDHRELGLPAFLVDARQLLHIGGSNTHAAERRRASCTPAAVCIF